VPRRSPDGVVECATSARVGPARGVPATAGGDTLAAAVAGAIEGVDLGGAGVSLGGFGVTLVRANASSYCVQSGSGQSLMHLAGPGGAPAAGAC